MESASPQANSRQKKRPSARARKRQAARNRKVQEDKDLRELQQKRKKAGLPELSSDALKEALLENVTLSRERVADRAEAARRKIQRALEIGSVLIPPLKSPVPFLHPIEGVALMRSGRCLSDDLIQEYLRNHDVHRKLISCSFRADKSLDEDVNFFAWMLGFERHRSFNMSSSNVRFFYVYMLTKQDHEMVLPSLYNAYLDAIREAVNTSERWPRRREFVRLWMDTLDSDIHLVPMALLKRFPFRYDITVSHLNDIDQTMASLGAQLSNGVPGRSAGFTHLIFYSDNEDQTTAEPAREALHQDEYHQTAPEPIPQKRSDDSHLQTDGEPVLARDHIEGDLQTAPEPVPAKTVDDDYLWTTGEPRSAPVSDDEAEEEEDEMDMSKWELRTIEGTEVEAYHHVDQTKIMRLIGSTLLQSMKYESRAWSFRIGYPADV